MIICACSASAEAEGQFEFRSSRPVWATVRPCLKNIKEKDTGEGSEEDEREAVLDLLALRC